MSPPAEAIAWMHVSEALEGRVNVKILPDGTKAIVLRREGRVFVFGEVCPHLGADLSEATYCAKEHTLRCRWHGYLFSADDGSFRENPNELFMAKLRTKSAHFDPTLRPRYRLPVVRHEIVDDRIYFFASRERRGAEA